jgi:hypothetical protein
MAARFLFPVLSIRWLEPYPWPHWVRRLSNDTRPSPASHPIRDRWTLRLSGALDALDIGTAIAEIVDYASGGDARALPDASAVLHAWITGEDRIVAGGLEADLPIGLLEPGCCCGLETWREWRRFVDGGEAPWWGHDGLSEVGRKNARILFRRGPDEIEWDEDAVRGELVAVERDLTGFVDRSAEWAAAIAPDLSDELRSSLRSLFTL